MPQSDDWEEPVDSWVDWLRAAGRQPTSIKQRTYQIRRLARDHAARSPWKLTTDELAQWLGRHSWSPQTRSSFQAAIRMFYTWAHTTGRITSNPAALLPSIRLPRGKPRPVDVELYRAALERADRRVELMLRLGWEAGLRRDEIARVHSGDLVADLDGWSLRITGKGGHVRLVPLVDDLAETIARARGYLFPGGVDDHLSRYQVGRLVRQAFAGRATTHQLRHAAGTRVYEASGGDIRLTQEFLGHASIATTQIYVATRNDAMRAAVMAAA